LLEAANFGFSVHLRNGVPQSNHVTPRGFGSPTTRVPSPFCEVYFQQKVTLVLYSCYYAWAKVLQKLYTLVVRWIDHIGLHCVAVLS
jgi:hypothetical protein